MPEIVHITFEKLTGLKGEIEGVFVCSPEEIDLKMPLIFVNYWMQFYINKDTLVFRQTDKQIFMDVVDHYFYTNYHEHFQYGTNFLIKSWSYGGGVRINSQSPN